jgi:hypothetical protein
MGSQRAENEQAVDRARQAKAALTNARALVHVQLSRLFASNSASNFEHRHCIPHHPDRCRRLPLAIDSLFIA